jgi:hypothetical protein
MKGGKKRMIKKILGILVVMSVLVLGFAGATPMNQQAYVTINGVVDVSVSSTLQFPAISPGNSGTATSTITLSQANTEDLTIAISLADGSDSLFTNIALTTLDTSIGGLTAGPKLKIGVSDPVSITVDDTDVTEPGVVQSKDITATLSVPVGTLPGPRQSTIVYTVTSPPPVQ